MITFLLSVAGALVAVLLAAGIEHAVIAHRQRDVRRALDRQPAADPNLVNVQGQPLPPPPARPLPHRPAPGATPTPRRHRLENATTGALSATQILELANAEADARHERMQQRATADAHP